MFFKSSKNRPAAPLVEPCTPKVRSKPLPDESSITSLSTSVWTAGIVTPMPVRAVHNRQKGASDARAMSDTKKKLSKTKASMMNKQIDDSVIEKPLIDHLESAHKGLPQEPAYFRERTTSKSKVPLKGILKPSKPFKEQDFNVPVIPPQQYTIKGGPYTYDQTNHPPHDTTMDGGGNRLHHTASISHSENTQRAAQSHYVHLQKPEAPEDPVGYLPGVPVIPGYYPIAAAFANPPKVSWPTNPPPAWSGNPTVQPSWTHGTTPGWPRDSNPELRYTNARHDRLSVLSNTQGRGEYLPGHASDNEGLARSSRTRVTKTRTERQTLNHHPTSRHGPKDTGVSTDVEDFSSSRRQSVEYPLKPALKPGYVRPHHEKVPQKEEAIALSWPLMSYAAYSRKNPTKPQIMFDIGFPPSMIRTKDNYSRPYSRELAKTECDIPASSHCTLKEMTIICDYRGLERWPIHVQNDNGLDCADVYWGIYNFFHVPLTHEERKIFAREVDLCQAAFRQRCKDHPGSDRSGSEDYELRQGVLRVDLLRSYRMFDGIVRRDRKWILRVDSPIKGDGHGHIPQMQQAFAPSRFQ